MPNFLVIYNCTNPFTLPVVIRAIAETDAINAILTARTEERVLTGVNCPNCVLAAVKLAQ